MHCIYAVPANACYSWLLGPTDRTPMHPMSVLIAKLQELSSPDIGSLDLTSMAAHAFNLLLALVGSFAEVQLPLFPERP